MLVTEYYLVAYNAFQFSGWSLVLFKTLLELGVSRSPANVYAAAGMTTSSFSRPGSTARCCACSTCCVQLLRLSAHGLACCMQASAKVQHCLRLCIQPLVRAAPIICLSCNMTVHMYMWACCSSPAALCSGLVRGSAPLAFLQWFGRSNVLFLLLRSIPEVRGVPRETLPVRVRRCLASSPAAA